LAVYGAKTLNPVPPMATIRQRRTGSLLDQSRNQGTSSRAAERAAPITVKAPLAPLGSTEWEQIGSSSVR